jgi:oligopeptide transport system substrate-binding protein
VPAICRTAFTLLGAAFLSACARRETAVESGDREEVLHRGVGYEVATLDPHLATGIAEQTILSALFEGLVREDPRDLHPLPGVAEHWEISADGLTYTFSLRPEARWSNGAPVTAGNFIDAWRRILTPSLGADSASMLDVLQGAEAFRRGLTADFSRVGARAAGDRTLVATLARVTPDFLSRLTHWAWLPVYLPAIAANGPVYERGNPWAQPGRLIGNGPFVLKSWRPDREIVVERSSSYWDAARVRLNAIHFYPTDVLDTEERGFRTGQLHITDALPLGKIDAYRREVPSRLRIDPYLATYYYAFNVRRPPLNDARVRRALGLAVDRRAIVDKILRGGQAPAPAFTPPGIGGYAPPSDFPTDFAQARRLLAEAGYPGGRGLPPLELLYNSSENHRLVAEAIQEMWRRELGVAIRLANQENKIVLAARSVGGFQILRGDWVADYLDPATFLDVWRGGSGANYSGWSDARYDALLGQAEGAADPAARNRLFGEAEHVLLEAAPFIPIYHYTHVYLIQPSVHGWFPTLLDHHPYQDVWLE